MMNATILVPIDFTPVTEGALKHAILLARQSGNVDVLLLHMCKSERDEPKAKDKLNILADKYSDQGIKLSVRAVVGGIEEIGRLAEVLEAALICMGTHGLKGIQYLVGSKAIKVVSGTTLPFIITQKDPRKDSIQEIVVPIDFASEEKRVLSHAASISKKLNARLHIIGASRSDQLLMKKVDLNLSFAQRFLQDKGVKFVVAKTAVDQDFQNEILGYCEKVNADLIAIVNHHEDGVRNLLGKNFDQNIITNKREIPVLMFTGKAIEDKRDMFRMFN